MFKTNTHEIYSTISHEHLDNLVNWATGNYPDSGLCLVECQDGRWFIEAEYGHAFDSFLGISRPELFPYSEPIFYSNRMCALSYAIEAIKQIYPKVEDKKILEYFEIEKD